MEMPAEIPFQGLLQNCDFVLRSFQSSKVVNIVISSSLCDPEGNEAEVLLIKFSDNTSILCCGKDEAQQALSIINLFT